MIDPQIYDFSTYQWALLIVCAFFVGMQKTGMPGIGTFVVPLVAMILPAGPSTGLLLGLLILADLFAAAYYRRHAQWHHIWGLLPWAMAGIVAGYLLMGRISNEMLRPMIAVIVLLMLVWGFLRKPQESGAPHNRYYIAFMGFAAGFTTMLANAAGPVMVAYLLASNLPKDHFIGTSAWFFFIINWLKVPFQIGLGGINVHSVRTDLMLIPAIIVGAVIGIVVLRKLPQKVFNVAVAILTAIAAIKLFF
jgi:uncharacterized membrane protein YfcA